MIQGLFAKMFVMRDPNTGDPDRICYTGYLMVPYKGVQLFTFLIATIRYDAGYVLARVSIF